MEARRSDDRRRAGRGLRLRLGFYTALLVGVAGGMTFMIRMPGRSHAGPLPSLSDGERQLSVRLRGHVERLAGEIGERNAWEYENLAAAAAYIETALAVAGYTVASQELTSGDRRVRNLEVARAGSGPGDEVVVIGAHYDSVLGSPGANDNASGVAALIELAHRFGERRPGRTVRFVAFANEEPPFFQTDGMGSLAYARRAREHGERIAAMLSLETIGWYADGPDTQHYPFPLGVFYPRRGDFVAFVGNLGSRGLVREVVASFRRHAAFPSEGAAAPGWLAGVGWSDHWAFWRHGYPGVMVTDTALFRYPHYHLPSDTPDRLDYDRLARVVSGLSRVISDLGR